MGDGVKGQEKARQAGTVGGVAVGPQVEPLLRGRG